jgi:predicted CoA-binding protein
MMKRKTLVIGASARESQYSNIAIRQLREKGHPVVAFGRETCTIADVGVETVFPVDQDIDTVTLYLNPERQQAFYEQIINLHPERIIFNPGTENPELANLATENGIEAIEACTLVMLSVGNY